MTSDGAPIYELPQVIKDLLADPDACVFHTSPHSGQVAERRIGGVLMRTCEAHDPEAHDR